MKKYTLFFLAILTTTTVAVAQESTIPEKPGEPYASRYYTASRDTTGFSKHSPPAGFFSAFLNSGNGYKITIKSEGGVVTVLEIPPGVYLNIQADSNLNPWGGESSVIRGDVVIRTRRIDEVKAEESYYSDLMMAKSPVEMRLSNVVVKLEEVKPS